MTRGKLLGNNASLFIFISILIMTQLISFLHFLLTAVRTGRLGVLSIKIYRGNNAVFVSVDLIGEKNQVILEYNITSSCFISYNRTFNFSLLSLFHTLWWKYSISAIVSWALASINFCGSYKWWNIAVSINSMKQSKYGNGSPEKSGSGNRQNHYIFQILGDQYFQFTCPVIL